jgi:CRP-like cAMP-binding protein
VSSPGHHRLVSELRRLAQIPEAEMTRLTAIFRPISLAQGDFLLRAGERPRDLGFVVSGLIRSFFVTRAGREVTRAFCQEGRFVASYAALLLDEPSRLSLQALEPTLLLSASFARYRELVATHPCWQAADHALAQRMIVSMEKREYELLLDDAVTRYLRFRAEFPGLEERVRQHQVASYLGVTPETLSRVRSRLPH